MHTSIQFGMREWIISVVCAIVLGVLIEIVLPNGKVAKYVKGTFALVVIFVIVAPLPKLIKSEWQFDFSTAWQNANATFEVETNRDYTDDKTVELQNYLAANGYDCEVNIEIGKETFEVERATIILIGDSKSADIVRDIVAKKLAISKSKVQLVAKNKRDDISN